MSRENIEVAREVLAAANRADVEGVLAVVHPEVELAPRLAGALEGRTYQGRDGIREYLADLTEAWASFEWEPERYIDEGDHVAVPCRFRAVGRGSEVPVEVQATLVCTVEGGKLRRVVSYVDEGDALEAIGRRRTTSALGSGADNVELVRRAFYPSGAPDLVERFADRDAMTARIAPYLHPDFEMLAHHMAPPGLSGGKGARGFVDNYAEWLSAWLSFRVTPIEFHDLGDRVLAVVRMGGRTRTHRGEVEQESAAIFGIEGGLIRSVKLFTRAGDARREAGLQD